MLYQDFILFAVGILLFSTSIFSSVFREYALFPFMLSFALLGLAVYDIMRILSPWKTIQNLAADKQGLAWIYIVGLGLSIPMCAFMYWVFDWPFDIIVSTVTPVYTMTGFMASSWAAVQLIVSYLLAFCLIFSVFWIIQNSKSPGVYF